MFRTHPSNCLLSCMCFLLICLNADLVSPLSSNHRLSIVEQKVNTHTFEIIVLKEEFTNLSERLTTAKKLIGNDLISQKSYFQEQCAKCRSQTENNTITDNEFGPSIFHNNLYLAFRKEKNERIRLGSRLDVVAEKCLNSTVASRMEFSNNIEKLKNENKRLEISMQSQKSDTDRLANEVKSLEKRLNVALDTITALSTSNLNTMDEQAKLKTFIDNLSSSTRNTNVAFSAQVKQPIKTLKPWETIKFERVLTNVGNAYSPKDSVFSAPRKGVYVFFVHLMGSKRNMETALKRNDQVVMHLYTGGKYYGRDSNMVVLSLDSGDLVKVVKYGVFGTSPFYIHLIWSTFSGYILYPLE